MTRILKSAVLCKLVLTICVFCKTAIPCTAQIPAKVDRVPGNVLGWEFADEWSRKWTLADSPETHLLVVAFFGTECPLARLYAPRLQSLADHFESDPVDFMTLFPNQQDSLTEIQSFIRRHGLKMKTGRDSANRLADALGATRTPEVVVIDRQRNIRYRGRIDDQYGVGYSRSQPGTEDLRTAIECLLTGKPLPSNRTEAVGCLIGRVRKPSTDSPVTYSNQVARLLQAHCVECHRPGEIAPFALTDYEEVAGWAAMIQEVIHDRRMPPWHANPEHGRFRNERRLSHEEIKTIDDWIAHGAPEGTPSEKPAPREFVTGWRLPKSPDLVIPMREKAFSVPDEGTVEYQYFAVDPGFTEDRWISATDIQPGNRAVVHHAIVFISPPVNSSRSGIGWLAAFAPGQGSMHLPEHQARLVPAGSKLIFQMHYTPNGSHQSDLTRLGLVFADPAKVTEQVLTLMAVEPEFEIPAHEADYRIETVFDRWPKDAKLLSIAPHMHLRGRSFRVETVPRDSRDATDVLLDVPAYDFNWQNVYRLRDPIALSPDFRVKCVAHFDNSEDNPTNPDPNSSVFWGDQSWEEMMVGFFEVAVPRDQLRTTSRVPSIREGRERRALETVKRLFDRFDGNKDGFIKREETPLSFAAFAFRKIDRNKDGTITQKEAFEFARIRSE